MKDELPHQPPTSESMPGTLHEKILKAAFEVFATNGYARTTTRALAEAAGITEVTLFRHFGSKEALFLAIIERYGGYTLVGSIENQLTGDYRADLHSFGKRFLKLALERSKVVRLMLSEAEHFPELQQALAQNSRQFREMLSLYLDQQIKKGKARKVNTVAAAQAFWGMILSYCLVVDALKEGATQDLGPEEAVATFVDIFIEGTIATMEKS